MSDFYAAPSFILVMGKSQIKSQIFNDNAMPNFNAVNIQYKTCLEP